MVMRRAARHSWVVWWRWLVTSTVFVTWVIAIAAQHARESNGSFGVQMSHVAAVATSAWLPLCCPRLAIRLLLLSLLGAADVAARPTRRR